MSRLRITPLNISCSMVLAWLLWDICFEGIVWKWIAYSLMLIVVMVITDLVFRFFLRKMKRIWLTECGFILFTVLLIWLMS